MPNAISTAETAVRDDVRADGYTHQIDDAALNDKLARWSSELPEIRRYIEPRSSEMAILLSGSVNDGLANETSDIDFIELYAPSQFIPGWTQRSDEGKQLLDPGDRGGFGIPQPNFLYWHHALRSGRRLQRALSSVEHVEYLQDQVVARNETNLLRIRGEKSPPIRAGITLPEAELRFLQRIYTGTVIYNSELVEQLRARLPAAELLNYNLVRQLTLLEGVVGDINGLSRERTNDDQDTIVLLLRKSLQHVVNIHLLAAGELNVSEKLVYRLLQRHAAVIGDNNIDDILSELRMAPAALADSRDEVLELVNRHLEIAGALSPYLAEDLRSRAKASTWNPVIEAAESGVSAPP